MLKASQITQKYDGSLMSVSSMIIREIRDRTDDGETIYYPELQFEVRNKTDADLSGLSAEIKYYDSSNEFLGLDSELRLDNLKGNDSEAFSLFIEAPEKVSRAELTIEAKRYGIREKLHSAISHPFSLAIIFGLLIYSNVKN